MQHAAELHMQKTKQKPRGRVSMPAALQVNLPDNEGILRVMRVGLGSRDALAAVGALLWEGLVPGDDQHAALEVSPPLAGPRHAGRPVC